MKSNQALAREKVEQRMIELLQETELKGMMASEIHTVLVREGFNISNSAVHYYTTEMENEGRLCLVDKEKQRYKRYTVPSETIQSEEKSDDAKVTHCPHCENNRKVLESIETKIDLLLKDLGIETSDTPGRQSQS